MSIWGKILGGVAGFALGGPLGALMGAAAGHAYDKMRSGHDAGGEGFGGAEAGVFGAQQRQVAFTIAVIALSAKMAKADGQVTREEINVFKQVFAIPPGEMENVGRMFNAARDDQVGFEIYAQQVAGLFPHEPAVLEELLAGLFRIALADGTVHPAEMDFLQRTATIFRIDSHTFDRIRATLVGGGGADPYEVLGVSAQVSDEDVKRAYRKLLHEHHPDKLMAEGMPPEFVEQANAQMAQINAAYDKIREIRGMKK